jgi:TATA-binding protein-associated factor Taf7
VLRTAQNKSGKAGEKTVRYEMRTHGNIVAEVNSNFRGRRRQTLLFQAAFCFEPKAKIKSEKNKGKKKTIFRLKKIKIGVATILD